MSNKAQTLAPGLQITPELQLVREIGRGSMGAVWLGKMPAGDVAVKFLADHLTDETSIQRFDREWAVASSIDCRHIVRMFQSGTTDKGQRYIVMELLDGETLENVLEGLVGGMSPTATLTLLRQVAQALDSAHAKGIVHRDIKPENIFLCKEVDGLIVKIVDFGLAKPVYGDLNFTATGVLVGTPYYMSPEQLLEDGKKVDHRADLWALGALAYRMLLGAQPFDADNLTDLLVRVATGNYLPVAEAGGAAPLVPFFARAFQVDREKRFSSAAELLRELTVALGLPVEDDGAMTTVVMGPSLDRTQILDEAPAAMPAFGNAPTVPFPRQEMPVQAVTLQSTPPRRAAEPGVRGVPAGPGAGVMAAIAVVALLAVGAGLFFGWRALATDAPATSASAAPPPPSTALSAPGPAPPPSTAPPSSTGKPAVSAPVPPAAPSIDAEAAKKKIAFITVHCAPECIVLLGGKKLGITPVDKRRIRPGKHKLLAFRKGFKNHEQRVEIVPGEHATFDIALKR